MERKRKGFTLTELVVVICIIGILLAVLIPLLFGYINKTYVYSDTQVVREINEALVNDSLENGKHENMTEALKVAEKIGYIVENINATKKGNEIFWDQKNDAFCYMDNNQLDYVGRNINEADKLDPNGSESYLLWRISDTVSADDKWSCYYTGTESIVNISKGFDAGNASISQVNYYHVASETSPAQTDVIIRTNGGSLTIYGPSDTVKHYGSASVLVIDAIKSASYHEFGQIVSAQIKTGRIVIETSEAEIENLLLVANEAKTAFEDIIVEVKSGAELPTFDRTEVEIDPKGTLVVNVVTPTSNEYVYLNKAGVVEQIVVTTAETADVSAMAGNVESKSTLMQKVAEEVANIGMKNSDGDYVNANNEVINLEDLTSVEQIVVEKKATVEEVTSGKTEFAGGIGTEKNPYLISNAEELSNVRNHLSASYLVIDDINMSEVSNWTPIGTAEAPFTGKFDGNNHRLFGLHTSSSLFGVVRGTNNAKLTGNKEDALDDNWELVEANVNESNYTCVIKDFIIDDFDITLDANMGGIANVVIDAYADNIEMMNSAVHYNEGYYTGTIFGEVFKSHVKGLHVASSNTITCNNNPSWMYNTGVIIGTIAGVSTVSILGTLSDMKFRTIIDECVNDADVQFNVRKYYVGGIVGSVYSSQTNQIIIDCENNGDITVKNLGTTGVSFGGICGANMSGKNLYLIRCTNTGDLALDPTGNSSVGHDGEYIDQISGICSYAYGPFVECENTGNLSGNVSYLGGICARISSQITGNPNVIFDNCRNTGELESANTSAKINEIAFVHKDLTTLVYSQTASAAQGITSSHILWYKNDVLTEYLSFDGTNNVDITPVDLVARLDLSEKIGGKVTLRVSDSNIALVGGENQANVKLDIYGDNNTITIPEGMMMNNISLNGDGNTFINNGSIGRLNITAHSLNDESKWCVNNGTMKCLFVVGSNDGYLNFRNNGLIDATEQIEGYAHAVQITAHINFTFDNYGVAKTVGGGHVFLGSSAKTIHLNVFKGSQLIKENYDYPENCSFWWPMSCDGVEEFVITVEHGVIPGDYTNPLYYNGVKEGETNKYYGVTDNGSSITVIYQ